MQTWEYKVVDIPMMIRNIEPAFNELGAEGWELVLYDLGRGLAVFKRPKS
ncbi:MAG TPA: hypothetical protein VF766_04975 [Pyrinomonadaceae bacterium]